MEVNYFASGKIYQKTERGQIVVGHFSTVASSNKDGDAKDLIKCLSDRVSVELGCDYSQVHVETLNKL